MQLALTHPLSNVAKFSGADGAISVSARLNEDAPDIRVHDNGIGASAEQLARVTELFFQGDATLNRAYEGAGLGLFSVRGIIKLHGGVLRFESTPGKAFTAVIRLPKAVTRRAQTAA